jgi:hypothetical protein
LGTFQQVEHVLLVGVGGGVPHYTDYGRHVRLGDVVLAAPATVGKSFIYQQCDSAKATFYVIKVKILGPVLVIDLPSK